MARYNDHYALLRRVVICHVCGKVNRCYIDDPTLQIKCGHCQSGLNADHTTISDTYLKGLRFDLAGYPLPPRPLTNLSRMWAEIAHLWTEGNLRSPQERIQERGRYDGALEAHRQLCEMWAQQLRERELLKEQEERERLMQLELERRRQHEQLLEKEKLQAEAEHRRREELERSGRAQLLRQLDTQDFSGRDFEILLGQIFEAVGCKCEVTKCSGDQGVDVIVCNHDRKRIAVQAKHWSGSVSNSAVQEVFSGMKYHKCDRAIVFATSGNYTKSARELAQELDVLLLGIDELL